MSTPIKGRPSRARDKLRNCFLSALADDFSAHGAEAIIEMRTKDPSSYIRAIASLMPKEMDITHQVDPVEHLTDEQLAALLDATERFLAERAGQAVDKETGGAEEPSLVH